MLDKERLAKYLVVELSPSYGRRYVLRKTVVIDGHTIPKGWVTNGANSPRMFWSIVPPNDSDMMPAILYHDYRTDISANNFNNGKGFDFKSDDIDFRDYALSLGNSKFKVACYYHPIRFYTKFIRPIKLYYYSVLGINIPIVHSNIKLINEMVDIKDF